MSIHVAVDPIPVFLLRKYLYNLDKNETGWVRASIVVISSYANDPLTFTVLIEDTKALFSYIPLNAVIYRFDDKPIVDSALMDAVFLKNLGCFPCPSEEVFVSDFHLNKVLAFFPERDSRQVCRYLLTLDWPNDNELFHLLVNEKGLFYLRPNHKMLLDLKAIELPPYKKLKAEYKV
jgi:hypothetical protein